MDQEGVETEREVYALLDLLGDLGGASEILLIVFGIIFYPISEFSFKIKAFQKLYLAKSKNMNIF